MHWAKNCSLKGVLQFFLVFAIRAKQRGEADARPTVVTILIIAFCACMWGAAFPLMFVLRSDDQAYDLDKRFIRKIVSEITLASLGNITTATAAFGVVAL